MPNNTKSDDRILLARVSMLSRQRPILLVGNFIVMLIVGLTLWPVSSRAVITCWCLANFLLMCHRLYDWYQLRRSPFESASSARRWMQRFMVFTFTGGLIWGVGGFLLTDSSDPLIMTFVITVFIGIGTAALPALCPHFKAFAAFVIPLLLLLAIKLYLEPGPFLNVVAILLFFYLIIILFFGHNLSVAITNSITLDLENTSLLEQVTKTKEEAESANIEKSRFLASVSHDVRQPLYAMGLFLGSLNRKGMNSDNLAILENIDNIYTALEDMCQALLEISRLDSGSIEPTMISVKLIDIVDRLMPDILRAAQEKNLELEVNVDEKILIMSDPLLMERILRNLLSNAIKYTDIGKIIISTTVEAGTVLIDITDTGHGISSDDYAKIFDEYLQLENPERDRSKGLGLGLSVVRRMTELMKYEIKVESILGHGSVFTLVVPVGNPSEIFAPTVEDYNNDITGLHIGVIDDEKPIRLGMETLLGNFGASVTSASDADELISKLSSVVRPIDLLICDFRLRNNINGFEAIELVRSAMDSELPALIMTGDTHLQFKNEAERLGLYILHKPVKISHLLNVVRKLV